MENWYDPYLILADPVIITNESHQILAINDSYIKTSGYQIDELCGKDAGAIKSGLTPISVYESLRKNLRERQPWTGIFTNKRPNGYLWNSFVTITPIETPDGVGYVGICRDIRDVTMQDVEQAYKELFQVIASTAESTDPLLEEHLSHVSQITELIASNLGLSDDVVGWFSMASYLHDVGKLFIPKEILFRPGRIAFEEREFIKSHTTFGDRFLSNLHECMAKLFGYSEALVFAKEMASGHHERFDGKGYPQGVQGNEIPLSARVVALADVIDALLSKRPYKSSWSFEDVKAYIVNERGKQFDPILVDIAIEHWIDIESYYYEARNRNDSGVEASEGAS